MGSSDDELELSGADLAGLDKDIEINGASSSSTADERFDTLGSPHTPRQAEGFYKEEPTRHGGDDYGQMLTLCSDDDEGEEIELDPPGEEDEYEIANSQGTYSESAEGSVEGGPANLPRGGSLGELLDAEGIPSPTQVRMQPGGRVLSTRPRSAVNPVNRKSSAHKRRDSKKGLTYRSSDIDRAMAPRPASSPGRTASYQSIYSEQRRRASRLDDDSPEELPQSPLAYCAPMTLQYGIQDPVSREIGVIPEVEGETLTTPRETLSPPLTPEEPPVLLCDPPILPSLSQEDLPPEPSTPVTPSRSSSHRSTPRASSRVSSSRVSSSRTASGRTHAPPRSQSPQLTVQEPLKADSAPSAATSRRSSASNSYTALSSVTYAPSSYGPPRLGSGDASARPKVSMTYPKPILKKASFSSSDAAARGVRETLAAEPNTLGSAEVGPSDGPEGPQQSSSPPPSKTPPKKSGRSTLGLLRSSCPAAPTARGSHYVRGAA
eukprot:CAMPEP_0118940616 /NCGR_PEP_ID=MMETSP1169-20130426/31863_1 /TAXON_ID=36882 /ORGANISM="Pyramimonas obovata, Strain CCMP722" /LENGTH=490 /DNA_ID=CAMNT_0006885149 /DNA_START=147 /DNA_END=1615 /DNA_ORIENTATION=-